ncbi:hypothetical protein BKA70DRAFT_1331260 [Coprinopsis sp. MPI-PUGE-AT-0042]|nr:hypothetical protein BKA70DRAFT_1331260 [Coprinopsis sp. MPI-PUGE-AT-0042]
MGNQSTASSSHGSFMKLPLEVFREILKMVSEDLAGDYFPARTRAYRDLLLVCRDWKDAVEGEKRLWTSCRLRCERDVPWRVNDRRQDLDALIRHYQRSGDLPLELHIKTCKAARQRLANLSNFILSPNWSIRWTTLSFHATDFEDDIGRDWIMDVLIRAHCMPGMSGKSPFENVQNLDIQIGAPGMGAIESTDFPMAHVFPNLQKLSIHLIRLNGAQFFPTQLALPKLESLRVEIPMNMEYRLEPRFFIRDILANAPALRYLEVEVGSPKSPSKPITHASLRVLVIKHLPIAMDELGTLSLPSLTTLVVMQTTLASKNALMNPAHGDHDPRKPGPLLVNAILRMVEQSGCRLEILKLQKVAMEDDDIQRLWASLTTLKEFVVEQDREISW